MSEGTCTIDECQAVTKTENTMRGVAPPAANARLEKCRRGHPFDEANTRYERGGTVRRCRACKRIRDGRATPADLNPAA